MASLVYIQEIRSDTFLYFSYKQYPNKQGESWKLRDIHNSVPFLSQYTSNYSADEIRAMAKKTGNYYLTNIPYHSINDRQFWQQTILEYNRKYGIEELAKRTLIIEGQIEMTVSQQEKELLVAFRKLTIPKQAVVVNMIATLLSP